MAKFKALGVYAGIGAMLIAFNQRKSWKVLGNLEDRKIHTFRDEDGTLTHESVDKFQNEILDSLTQSLNAELRTL